MEEWVSLKEVYDAYKDCRKRKRSTESCAEFEVNEVANLVSLWEDLNNGTYEIGYSNAFCVTRPKIREVFAAEFRDRIVHHLLMIKTVDLFEKEFIPETFNCRKGKGTAAAHEKALQFSVKYEGGWVLECDIKGFFMSIKKSLLADRLEAFLRKNYKHSDLEQIVWLTRMVALHCPEKLCIRKGDLKLWDELPKEKSLFTCGNDRGMAIGNLTSQIYANFYLSDFDHWISSKDVGYCRYVDDFRVFAKDKETLLQLLPQIREFLQNKCFLTLHPNKIELQPIRHGFSFVGVIVKQGRIYIGNRTKGNCMRMLNLYNHLQDSDAEESVDKFVQRYNSYMGYMVHYYTYAIRWDIWNYMSPLLKKYVYITGRMAVLKARTEYRKITKLKLEYYDLCKHPRFGVQKVRKKQAA